MYGALALEQIDRALLLDVCLSKCKLMQYAVAGGGCDFFVTAFGFGF